MSRGSTPQRKVPDILSPAPQPGSATILALHGGGFLGYFSACIAATLQARRQALKARGPFSRSFDAICGTSVGAILAAGIATNTAPSDIVSLMAKRGEAIFPKRRFMSTAPGILAARFDPAPLRCLLAEILGTVRLGEIDRVLVIPAVNESTGRPVIFKSTEPSHWDLPLLDVVMASAAAPLYFPLHRIGSERYTDGGLIANGPALLASAELTSRFGIPARQQRVISIGTTRTAPASAVNAAARDGWGGLRWIWGGGRLQQLLMSCQEDLHSDMLAGLGPGGRQHLDLDLTCEQADKVHMVKAYAEAMTVLNLAGTQALSQVTPQDRGFLDRILARQARSLAWRRDAGRLMPVLA